MFSYVLSGWIELSDTLVFHNSLKANYLFTLKLVLPLTVKYYAATHLKFQTFRQIH